MLWQVIPEPHSKQSHSSYTISATLAPIVVLNNYNITYNTAKFIITDTTPVIADLPQTSTIDCTATPAFAVAMATDACGSTFTLTSADVTTDGDSGSYSVTRTGPPLMLMEILLLLKLLMLQIQLFCNCRFTTNFNDRLYCYSSFLLQQPMLEVYFTLTLPM
jgi:hypothetical protein